MYAAEITFFEVLDSGNTFVYKGSLPNNQRIETGNFVVIYDIRGLLSGSGPANWQFTKQLNAAGVTNDPSVFDAVFTYEGPALLGVQGELPLGNFYLTGAFAGQREGSYLTRTVRVGSGNNSDTLLDQSGSTTVPEVPEPSTATLLVIGLLTIGQRFRRRGLGSTSGERVAER